MRKIHIVGNWKMNQNLAEIETFFSELPSLKEYDCEAWISPQSIHLPKVIELASKTNKVLAGSQNCAYENKGAFTGEISPMSIKDLGANFTLVGHSERRAIYGEDHNVLNKKTKVALENGLTVIFCIGETLEEREAGNVETVITEQLKEGLKDLKKNDLSNVILAYEPVWAIGTGVTATPEQAEEVHAMIRGYLDKETEFSANETVILYGGSVKPSNVIGLLSNKNIDGALVGGASLKASDFSALVSATKELNK